VSISASRGTQPIPPQPVKAGRDAHQALPNGSHARCFEACLVGLCMEGSAHQSGGMPRATWRRSFIRGVFWHRCVGHIHRIGERYGRVFSKQWYPYPWTVTISVVGFSPGMEYAGIVFDGIPDHGGHSHLRSSTLTINCPMMTAATTRRARNKHGGLNQAPMNGSSPHDLRKTG